MIDALPQPQRRKSGRFETGKPNCISSGWRWQGSLPMEAQSEKAGMPFGELDQHSLCWRPRP